MRSSNLSSSYGSDAFIIISNEEETVEETALAYVIICRLVPTLCNQQELIIVIQSSNQYSLIHSIIINKMSDFVFMVRLRVD